MILCLSFVRSSWRGPGEILWKLGVLTWSAKGPLWEDCVRSCWNPSQEVLADLEDLLHGCFYIGNYIGGSCLKIFWVLCDKSIYMNRRSCCMCDHVQPHLSLFHSYCCLCQVHCLPTPPRCFGSFPGLFFNLQLCKQIPRCNMAFKCFQYIRRCCLYTASCFPYRRMRQIVVFVHVCSSLK